MSTTRCVQKVSYLWSVLRFRNKTQRITPSYFTSHRYRYKLTYIDPWSEINSWILHILPPWSTSRGMTSCIGRTRKVPFAPRSTAVLVAPSLSTFSSSTRAFFHMCLGRWSSWRKTMSPVRTFPDLLFGWEITWKDLSSMRYSFSQRLQKSSAILLVLWCVFLRLPSVCGSVVEGNVVSFAPQRKCAGVNASSVSCVMGLEFRRLRCWLQWWPTLHPWPVTAPTLSLGIFLWCQSFLNDDAPPCISRRKPCPVCCKLWRCDLDLSNENSEVLT